MKFPVKKYPNIPAWWLCKPEKWLKQYRYLVHLSPSEFYEWVSHPTPLLLGPTLWFPLRLRRHALAAPCGCRAAMAQGATWIYSGHSIKYVYIYNRLLDVKFIDYKHDSTLIRFYDFTFLHLGFYGLIAMNANQKAFGIRHERHSTSKSHHMCCSWGLKPILSSLLSLHVKSGIHCQP